MAGRLAARAWVVSMGMLALVSRAALLLMLRAALYLLLEKLHAGDQVVVEPLQGEPGRACNLAGGSTSARAAQVALSESSYSSGVQWMVVF